MLDNDVLGTGHGFVQPADDAVQAGELLVRRCGLGIQANALLQRLNRVEIAQLPLFERGPGEKLLGVFLPLLVGGQLGRRRRGRFFGGQKILRTEGSGREEKSD